jgi:hypothetical protein
LRRTWRSAPLKPPRRRRFRRRVPPPRGFFAQPDKKPVAGNLRLFKKKQRGGVGDIFFIDRKIRKIIFQPDFPELFFSKRISSDKGHGMHDGFSAHDSRRFAFL